MVHLNRITTKSGDLGITSLGDGTRIPKSSLRIQAIGVLDELNAIIGIALSIIDDDAPAGLSCQLQSIQHDLFDLGADLAVPITSEKEPVSHIPASVSSTKKLRMTASHVAQLECWTQELTGQLQPLTSFVLPGGTATAAQLHFARTVCRRAERICFTLSEQETLNPQGLIYLNRLSDLLFVQARSCNQMGTQDLLWKPHGGTASQNGEV